MNYDIALHTLELEEDFNFKQLRKAYLRKCLKYHPDKNGGLDVNNYFKLINESYEFLSRFNKNSASCFSSKFSFDDLYTMNLSEILKECIHIITPDETKNNHNFMGNIVNIVSNLNQHKYAIALKIFDELDHERCVEIYNYISKYKGILNISNEFISKIREILNRYQSLPIITLRPKISDLLNANIYIYEEDDEDIKYYVPLWHQELHFNKYIFDISPLLSKDIGIDDDNNVIITKYIDSEQLIKPKI